MQVQYCVFMSVNFMVFLILSICLVPVAYFRAVLDKFKHMKYHNKQD